MDAIEIFIDNESKSYHPGESVSGNVLLKADSEFDSRGFTFAFKGQAITKWRMKHKKHERYHWDSYTHVAFPVKLEYQGINNKTTFPPGHHQYSFSFKILDIPLPSTFYSELGNMEYYLVATLRRSHFLIDISIIKPLFIEGILDLNKELFVKDQADFSISKGVGVCGCGRENLKINVKLDRTGYCLGERIPVEVEVSNRSGRNVNKLLMLLQQKVIYTAKSATTSEIHILEKVKKETGINSGCMDEWHEEIVVPNQIPPSRLGTGCDLIDVSYEITVQGFVNGINNNLEVSCPIVIGTVPIQEIEHGKPIPRI